LLPARDGLKRPDPGNEISGRTQPHGLVGRSEKDAQAADTRLEGQGIGDHDLQEASKPLDGPQIAEVKCEELGPFVASPSAAEPARLGYLVGLLGIVEETSVSAAQRSGTTRLTRWASGQARSGLQLGHEKALLTWTLDSQDFVGSALRRDAFLAGSLDGPAGASRSDTPRRN
jgi:hypothetical protein